MPNPCIIHAYGKVAWQNPGILRHVPGIHKKSNYFAMHIPCTIQALSMHVQHKPCISQAHSMQYVFIRAVFHNNYAPQAKHTLTTFENLIDVAMHNIPGDKLGYTMSSTENNMIYVVQINRKEGMPEV